MRQSIYWPRQICEGQPLKKLMSLDIFRGTIPLKFFKGCLPQTLLDPFLNI